MQQDRQFPLSALFAVIAFSALAVLIAMRGPAPVAASANSARFSAERARGELLRIAPSDTPRFIGSDEAKRTRDRIIARFRELGYSTTLQTAFVCSPEATCATVENIIARAAGDTRPAIFGVAHYDSVAAGPGISDDATGVATLLEIARAMRGERGAHPVAFLITDGEEEGLLGARAFVADPAMKAQVLRIVNLENRGPRAPAFMFETSANNLELVRGFGRGVPRPVASSLFFSIYEMLPNDTDLSVFKRAGLQGLNFAAIRDPWAYHTPLDSHARLDMRALQHYGDSALGTIRSLSRGTNASATNATYFDVLGRVLFAWPSAMTTILATVLLAASLLALVISIKRGSDALALFAFPAATILGAFGGGLVTIISYVRAGDVRWLAFPVPAIAAAWLAGGAAFLVFATLLRRRTGAAPLLAATSFWWSGLALAAALYFAGAAYLFAVPAVFLTLASLLLRRSTSVAVSCTLLAVLVASLLWLPFATVLYDALAASALIAVAVMLTIVVSAGVALIPQGRASVAVAMYAAAAALSLASAILPPATVRRPQPLNLTLYAEEGSTVRWLASAMTQELRRTTPFDTSRRGIVPYSSAKSFVGDASEFRFAAPDVAVQHAETTEGNSWRFTITSRRGARQVALVFRPSAAPLRVMANGVAAPLQWMDAGRWNLVEVDAAGAVVDIELPRASTLDAYAKDTTFGLPPSAANIAEARTRSGGSPIGNGDIVVAAKKVAIQ